MAAEKKKLTHPLPEAGHSRRCFARLMALFTLLPHRLSLSDSVKETGIQTPIRWFFRDTSLPSSRSAGFPNKVVFLASAPRLRFIGLLYGEQSELGLSNTVSVFNLVKKNPAKMVSKVANTILQSHQQSQRSSWSVSSSGLGIVGIFYLSHSNRHVVVIFF